MASKKSSSRKRGDDNEDQRRTKRPYAKTSAGYQGGKPNRVKKFCQYCKDNNGKHWTHDTDECFVKDKTNKAKKEANAMEDMQKELHEMKNLVKGLKKKMGSDSDTN